MPASRAAHIKLALCSAALALSVSVAPAGAFGTGTRPHTTTCGWRVTPSPVVTAAESRPYRRGERNHPTLVAVGARAEKNVWIIGQASEHWNGYTWRVFGTAVDNGDSLDAIVVVSHTNVWAVGGGGNRSGGGAVTNHWNGSWSNITPPNSDVLSAVAVSPEGDVWAAGGKYDSDGEDEAWADHWTRNGWIGMEAEPPTFDIPGRLTSIAPLAPDDVIAGDVDDASMQWNGSKWTATPTPIQIMALAPLSPTSVWGIGNGIAHWDGSTWTKSNLALPSGWIPYLKSTSAAGPNDIWAVGEMDQLNSQTHKGSAHRALVVHWNGKRWSLFPPASLHAYYRRFDGIATLPNGDAWMIGTERTAKKGKLLPLIERYSPC